MSTPNSEPAQQPAATSPEELSGGPATARPLGVYVITAVLALEAAALAGVGAVFTAGVFSSTPYSMASAVFLIVLLFVLAIALAAVAVNAWKGYRWTRSAAFVWQLLMAAIAVPALLSGATLLGVCLLVPALAAAYYLFTPRVVAFSLRSTGEDAAL